MQDITFADESTSLGECTKAKYSTLWKKIKTRRVVIYQRRELFLLISLTSRNSYLFKLQTHCLYSVFIYILIVNKIPWSQHGHHHDAIQLHKYNNHGFQSDFLTSDWLYNSHVLPQICQNLTLIQLPWTFLNYWWHVNLKLQSGCHTIMEFFQGK